MWGAVIGDLAGSVYEFEQLKGIKSIKTNEIIPNNAFFSDDTILTMAIAEAVQTDMNYEEHLKKYTVYPPPSLFKTHVLTKLNNC